jgi:4-amino-4-deoxy-L-arabinose transferase-like glycosyltransferase
VSRREQQLSLALMLLASLWFGAAASWGMWGPLLAGHYAASASVGIIAENMLRWDIAGPVWEYTANKPSVQQYYCHHPWGIFWTTAAFMKVLGRHDYVCRLPAVLLSTATPPLLYALARSIWRPAAGAVAAVSFVVLPITLAFANFNALEVPVIAWSTLGLWATVRHQQTYKRRYLVLSLVAFALALHADWPAYILVGVILAFGLVRGILFRRFMQRTFGPVRLRPFVRWWALTVVLSAGTLLLYFYLFQQSGKLSDLLGSYRHRSSGSQLPLRQVLDGRRYWIELSFTPIAIFTGKLAAVVCTLRLFLRRNAHDIVPLAVLAMATVQYLMFKQGADVHIYWPHYFAMFFALGMGALTTTAMELMGTAKGKMPHAPLLAIMPLALALLTWVARDGLPALSYARQTGGRFNEKGLLIHSDGGKTAFLRWLEPQLASDAVVSMHIGMKTSWSQSWALGGRVVHAHRPLPHAHGAAAREQIYLADTRFMLDHLQKKLATKHHVVAVGPFWHVKEGEAAAPIDAFAIVEREPTFTQWWLSSGTEPVRTIAPDPYLTWELRKHFGQTAQRPNAGPEGFEQKRIAHNIAVDSGNNETAARIASELSASLGEPRVRFDDGLVLVGTHFRPGARAQLVLLFRANGPSKHDMQLSARSRVLAPARWSTTMADPTVREVGLPAAIAPMRWRAGFLYSYRVPIRKRPGREEYQLFFRVRRGSTQPKRKPKLPLTPDSKSALVVLTLE